MSEAVERITFENHAKRREREAQSYWKQRAAATAREAEKNRRVRAWLHTLTYMAFMVLGAAIAMTAVFMARGDLGAVTTSVTVCFASLVAGIMFADKIER